MKDGTWIEAGKLVAGMKWNVVYFEHVFDDIPVAVSQVTTQSRKKAYNTRQRYVVEDSFEVKMQAAENKDVTEIEEISYVVWSMVTNPDSDWFVGLSANNVNDQGQSFTFTNVNSATTPAFFGAMQTADGVNTAGLRYRSLTGSGVEVFVEEETSLDGETEHTTEKVGYIALWGASKGYDDLYVEPPPT